MSKLHPSRWIKTDKVAAPAILWGCWKIIREGVTCCHVLDGMQVSDYCTCNLELLAKINVGSSLTHQPCTLNHMAASSKWSILILNHFWLVCKLAWTVLNFSYLSMVPRNNASIRLVGLLLNCFVVSHHFLFNWSWLFWPLINEITAVNGPVTSSSRASEVPKHILYLLTSQSVNCCNYCGLIV